MPRLHLTFSNQNPRTLEFSEAVVVGRALDCDVCIADSDVSRRHCRIEFTVDRWTVRDLGSTNGTFVNGVRLEQSPLNVGDTLRVGNAALRFDLEDCRSDDEGPTVLSEVVACEMIAVSQAALDDSFVAPAEFAQFAQFAQERLHKSIADTSVATSEPKPPCKDELDGGRDGIEKAANAPAAAGPSPSTHNGVTKRSWGPSLIAGLEFPQPNHGKPARPTPKTHAKPIGPSPKPPSAGAARLTPVGPKQGRSSRTRVAVCAGVIVVLTGMIAGGWVVKHQPSPEIVGPNGTSVRVIDN